MKNKVYCETCRYFVEIIQSSKITPIGSDKCIYRKNIKMIKDSLNWKMPMSEIVIYRRHPSEINKFNYCGWWEAR